MNAIELRQVNFSYDGKTKILENTGFTAEYGEVTLLSGHSGEGKSTLMYIVSGIIPNVNYGELSGEVKIAGEDIKGKKLGYVCRKVGVVLQNADEQIIQKVVEDEIAFGCENLAFPPEKIQKQIDIVCNLLKLDKSWKCRTLSGGQKQRLITASTLAMGQKIIILDEPLANLDKLSHRTRRRKVFLHHLFAERRQPYCTRLVPQDISLRFGIDVELYRIRRRHVQVLCNFVPLCTAVLPLQLLYGYKIFKL